MVVSGRDVPLIATAVMSYITGLFTGFAGFGGVAGVGGGLVTLAALLAPSVLLAPSARSGSVPRARMTVVACSLLIATGAMVAAGAESPLPLQASYGRTNFANGAVPQTMSPSLLERWRNHAGASIDSLFGPDAPVVRALLIADAKQLPPDVRERYARAGLVHILSISGLHVAIIAGAVLLALRLARLPVGVARWLAAAITVLYVVAIGAPPPALRSGVMLAAVTAGWAFQRPVSPWATLALGALVPVLLDPRTALNLGYQLSVIGFAAITAAAIWTRRELPAELRGIRRTLVNDFVVATVAAFASAPLVAWHFARISLIAPFSNMVAAPIVAVMQPALFLAMVLAPFGSVAQVAADGARVLVRALDAVAYAAAAVPGGSVVSAPSLTAAILCGVAAAGVLAAASARRERARWLIVAGLATVAVAWNPILPASARGMEIHMIDVGQGDAIAIRTPRGRWVVVDAGGGRGSRHSGRRIVVPYLRRLGGDVAMLVMTHPHDDHVGGAAALISVMRPDDIRDAAFAGTSASYREALVAARTGGVPWGRIRPGDSVGVDGVVVTFLAPDSAWTASLRDPNLASAMMLVRYGSVRALLTGDAEAPEEAWLLANTGVSLGAHILKVAHHGSATGTTGALLAAVQPDVALISVGAGNRYRHPSVSVLDSLAVRGIRVARTDLLGTIVVRTDVAGTRFDVTTRAGIVSSHAANRR